jgi:hypothetical protein
VQSGVEGVRRRSVGEAGGESISFGDRASDWKNKITKLIV